VVAVGFPAEQAARSSSPDLCSRKGKLRKGKLPTSAIQRLGVCYALVARADDSDRCSTSDDRQDRYQHWRAEPVVASCYRIG